MGHHLLRHQADMAAGDVVEARAQLAVTFGPWALFPYSGEGTVSRPHCCGVWRESTPQCLLPGATVDPRYTE
jgi:hypothetical protein